MATTDMPFERAYCRIDVVPRTDDEFPEFAARLSVIDRDGARLRPLVSNEGARLEIHGASEALALNSAVTFLESTFGPPAQTTGVPIAEGLVEGEPLQVPSLAAL